MVVYLYVHVHELRRAIHGWVAAAAATQPTNGTAEVPVFVSAYVFGAPVLTMIGAAFGAGYTYNASACLYASYFRCFSVCRYIKFTGR